MRNILGRTGAGITGLTVIAFAVCMLISFEFGSYFVCIFLALGFVMLTAAFADECGKDRKAAGIAACVFAGVYAVLILIVYFTQCTTVINEPLSEQAKTILDYRSMSLLFNLDLLGYGIMALSAFLTGLTLTPKSKRDRALKNLLLIHGVFFISCLILPMTGMFVSSGGDGAVGGTVALEFWCAYFLPVCVLSFLHFRDGKKDSQAPAFSG